MVFCGPRHQNRHFEPPPERYGRKVLHSASGRLVGRAADTQERYPAAAARVRHEDNARSDHEDVPFYQKLKEKLDGTLPVPGSCE